MPKIHNVFHRLCTYLCTPWNLLPALVKFLPPLTPFIPFHKSTNLFSTATSPAPVAWLHLVLSGRGKLRAPITNRPAHKSKTDSTGRPNLLPNNPLAFTEPQVKIRILILSLGIALPIHAAGPKVHTVSLGAIRRVPFTQPDATPEAKSDETSTIKVRPLIVDDRQRDWTTGEAHDITDRTFAIRRALRINDALPTETVPRWIWQPGPWITVDRVTGHITPLHLPDFDPLVSNAVWFRDYAAYCGTASTAKGGSLYVIVAQLGARRPVVQKPIGHWPQPNHFIPVCQPAKWQRQPLSVTIQPTGGEPATYDVVGTSALVEEGDNDDSN